MKYIISRWLWKRQQRKEAALYHKGFCWALFEIIYNNHPVSHVEAQISYKDFNAFDRGVFDAMSILRRRLAGLDP